MSHVPKKGILHEIDEIITDGITSQELERAKRKTMASAIYRSPVCPGNRPSIGK